MYLTWMWRLARVAVALPPPAALKIVYNDTEGVGRACVPLNK